MKPGPVVVITGGSAGAGRAAARAFAQKRFQVGLLARGLERLGISQPKRSPSPRGSRSDRRVPVRLRQSCG